MTEKDEESLPHTLVFHDCIRDLIVHERRFPRFPLRKGMKANNITFRALIALTDTLLCLPSLPLYFVSCDEGFFLSFPSSLSPT